VVAHQHDAAALAIAVPLIGGRATPTAVESLPPLATRFTLRVPLVLTPHASRWLAPTDRITPAQGCVWLTPGINGVKVKLVQRRLGMPASTWETMDATTSAQVKAFQAAHGLAADGVVGPVTWRAMGFVEDFCFDRFQMQPELPLGVLPLSMVDNSDSALQCDIPQFSAGNGWRRLVARFFGHYSF
jgi:hypothetical protein